MPQRKIGRREFLKLAIASAAAAGLSHFRILNIGGADVALAQPGHDDCPSPTGAPDTCAPPNNPDTCPEGEPTGGTDSCLPPDDPDFCEPSLLNEIDECANDPDVCDPSDPVSDVCIIDPGGVDFCEPGPAPPPADTCDPVTPGDPDYCTPGTPGGPPGNEDVCPDLTPGDGDACVNAAGLYDEDICDTTDPYEDEDICPGPPPETPDFCDPANLNPDDPNPVTVGSVGAESASSILPSLGGVAAALGAAALWLRHRLRPEKPEEEEST